MQGIGYGSGCDRETLEINEHIQMSFFLLLPWNCQPITVRVMGTVWQNYFVTVLNKPYLKDTNKLNWLQFYFLKLTLTVQNEGIYIPKPVVSVFFFTINKQLAADMRLYNDAKKSLANLEPKPYFSVENLNYSFTVHPWGLPFQSMEVNLLNRFF